MVLGPISNGRVVDNGVGLLKGLPILLYPAGVLTPRTSFPPAPGCVGEWAQC